MLICDYIVESIDGDYAHLRRTDLPEEELKLVARALLPFDITEGCRLHYEMMQEYEIPKPAGNLQGNMQLRLQRLPGSLTPHSV